MALMSFIAKNVKRSAGKNIIGAVAYRAGISMTNAQGEVFDFTPRKRAKTVAHTEIFLPTNAPDWAYDRNKLWNAADTAERKANAVTGREFILNLPHELDDNQRLDLVARFARELVQRHGCAIDAAVHRPNKKGDERNHHVHMMLSTRRLDELGFGEKTRELDTKKNPALEKCRELWATFTNEALAAAGHDARIDHRSYRKQGIDKLPQWHLGSKNADLERQGIRTVVGDHNRIISKINMMKSAPALAWTFTGWTRQEELAQEAAEIREVAAQRAQRAADKAKQQEIQRAADAEEAAENALLAKLAQEDKERQAEEAKIARIDDLRAQERGLRRGFMDEANRTIAAEDRIANDPSSKYADDPLAEVRITNAPAENKAYQAWVVVVRQIEDLGEYEVLQAEEPQKQGLLNRLFGKQQPREPETFIECMDFANSRRPQIKSWLQEEQGAKANAAKFDADRVRQYELDKQKAEAAEHEEKLRNEANAAVRAAKVAERDAPRSTPEAEVKLNPRRDDGLSM